MNKLRELRKEKNFSLRDLAEQIHIDKSTLSRYERDEQEIKSSDLILFCNFFDVSSDYLLGNTDIRKNPARHTSIDPNDVSFALHSTIDKLSEADKKFILQMAQRMLDPNDSHH